MNRFIKWSSILAVIAIAVVTGWVSYTHAYHVAVTHHQTGALGSLYPLSVDGLIYAASMVLLHYARKGVAAPPLARVVLIVGIVATLGVNFWAGFRYGTITGLIGSWPGVALILGYELLMLIIKDMAIAGPESHADGSAGVSQGNEPSQYSGGSERLTGTHRTRARHAPGAPTLEAAEREFYREIQNGIVPTYQEIKDRLRVGQGKAESFQRHIAEKGRAAREAA